MIASVQKAVAGNILNLNFRTVSFNRFTIRFPFKPDELENMDVAACRRIETFKLLDIFDFVLH